MFCARRDAYLDMGGHKAIRASRHDGLALPMAFRRHGYMTDLFDASDIAECRMYDSAGAVWRGFGKNATEGMASPRAIGLWTLLLGGGFVWPWVMGIGAAAGGMELDALAVTLVATAIAAGVLDSAVIAWRCGQTLTAAALRPVGVLLLLAIQWDALVGYLRGRPAVWRGRAYAS